MFKTTSRRGKGGRLLDYTSTADAGLFASIPNAADLALRLDASTLTLANGALVPTWADTSGNARNATQATSGNQPTFVTNAQNGLPVVRFNGSKSLSFAAGLFSTLTEAMMFIVVKAAIDPPTVESLSGLCDFGTDVNGYHYPYTDGIIYDPFGTNLRKTTVNPTPSLALWNIYAVSSKTNAWFSYLNNTQLYTTASNTFAFPSVCKVGESKSPSFSFNGDIAELLIYRTIPVAADRGSINSFLKTKWGTA